jgi:hypothetical protein
MVDEGRVPNDNPTLASRRLEGADNREQPAIIEIPWVLSSYP